MRRKKDAGQERMTKTERGRQPHRERERDKGIQTEAEAEEVRQGREMVFVRSCSGQRVLT